VKLEILKEKPNSVTRPAPLLFLHGMCQGAWVFKEHFMPFFVKHGYECYAMSLRGHGESEGQEKIKSFTMADYVNDLEQVINQLEKPPVVISHSLGGLVSQVYLKSHQLPASVLIAPCPNFNFFFFFLRFTKRYFTSAVKLLVTQRMNYALDTIDKCRVILFRKDTPDEIVNKFRLHVQDDSFKVFMQMCFQKLANPELVKTPLLIIGGTDDFLFPVREMKAIARAYGTEAVFFQNMSHHMVLDQGWEKVANHILSWLSERGL